MAITWSPQQQTIFDTGALPGNLAIRARAGTGKTTTGIELAKRLMPEYRTKKAVFLAFNTSIKEELEAKVPYPMQAKTAHSIGRSTILREAQGSILDKDKTYKLIKAYEKENGVNLYGYHARIKDLTSWAKNAGLSWNEKHYEAVMNKADWLGFDDGSNLSIADLARITLAILGMSADQVMCHDFDDMIWMPYVLEWTPPKYDLIMVDEAQDLNTVQHWLVQGMAKPTSKVIVIGDDRQAIYGWRGAVDNSFDELATKFGATVLPLTYTRRCPKAVVDQAKKLVPDFQAHPDAPTGEVRTVTTLVAADLRLGDAVISRINAPLMKLCMEVLLTGRRARIIGSNTGKQLLALVKKSKAVTLDDLAQWLVSYTEKETKRLESKLEQLEDTLDKISTLQEMVRAAADLSMLESMLKELFVEDKGVGSDKLVTFSTAHRAKGLEFDRVFLLNNFHAKLEGENDNIQEANVFYVAITRAKDTLVYVQS